MTFVRINESIEAQLIIDEYDIVKDYIQSNQSNITIVEPARLRLFVLGIVACAKGVPLGGGNC